MHDGYKLETMTREEYELFKRLTEQHRSCYDGSTGSYDDDDSSDARWWELLAKTVYLGEGCARAARLVHVEGREPFVFKYNADPYRLIGDGLDGIDQMETELDVILENEDHPHIPQVYDCDREHCMWMEMEYLSHPSEEQQEDMSNVYREWVADGLGLDRHEIRAWRHWGVNAAGEMKILDLGVRKL